LSVSYHVYANGGVPGTPIDWTSIVATTASLSWTSAALLASTSWRFGVRAFDTVTGLEDQSVDAQIEITLDGSQADVTGLPPAPSGLSASATSNGGYRVEWAWTSPSTPTGFKIYLGTPTPDYSTPVATVPFAGYAPYRYNGTGLSDGVDYQVAVRAYNAVGIEPNSVVASVTGTTSHPSAVDGLAVAAT
jgi:hypothetical protein